jgi:hypothetical protein
VWFPTGFPFEGEQIGDDVQLSLEMLGCQTVSRPENEAGYLPSDHLDSLESEGVCWHLPGAEQPSDG